MCGAYHLVVGLYNNTKRAGLKEEASFFCFRGLHTRMVQAGNNSMHVRFAELYSNETQNSRARLSTIGKVVRLTLLGNLRLRYGGAILTSSDSFTHARQDMPAVIDHVRQVVVASN